MPGPDEEQQRLVTTVETIGDAAQVGDIYAAMHAGYELAAKY